MTTLTWPPRSTDLLNGQSPYRYGIDASGRRVAFVRELATQDGYRVSLFPDGNHDHAVEGRVRTEAFAIKMATRWMQRRLRPEAPTPPPHATSPPAPCDPCPASP